MVDWVERVRALDAINFGKINSSTQLHICQSLFSRHLRKWDVMIVSLETNTTQNHNRCKMFLLCEFKGQALLYERNGIFQSIHSEMKKINKKVGENGKKNPCYEKINRFHASINVDLSLNLLFKYLLKKKKMCSITKELLLLM